MCGRFVAAADTQELVEAFLVDEVVESVPPTWNAAPTTKVAAVVDRLVEGHLVRRLVAPRWGLVPPWSKDARGAARLINARVETVAQKPSFRRAFASQRCLVPASGYYEWKLPPSGTGARTKQPYYLYPASGDLFAMAGLFEFWRDPTGEWVATCAVLTTEASEDVADIHNRMPVGVVPGAWDDWLDPDLTDPAAALGLLDLGNPPRLAARPVSSRVNSVRNNGPELVSVI